MNNASPRPAKAGQRAYPQTRIRESSIFGGDVYKNKKRIDMGVKIATHRSKVSNVLPSQEPVKHHESIMEKERTGYGQ